VSRAADREGASSNLVQPRLAARGVAVLKAWDLVAAWWRTTGGCAAARDVAGLPRLG
jgi:hypothetical protein